MIRHAHPEFWIHGMANIPLLNSYRARGTRVVIDLYTEGSAELGPVLAAAAAANRGIIACLRWADPKRDKFDKPPGTVQGDGAIGTISTLLSSPTMLAFAAAGLLGLQIFNEVGGGPGAILPGRLDGMYGWAQDAVDEWRVTIPNVKIIGPGLTYLQTLDVPESELAEDDVLEGRVQSLERAMLFTQEYCDAADIHLINSESAAWAEDRLNRLDRGFRRRGYGKDLSLVALEWGITQYVNRTDLIGAIRQLRAIRQLCIDRGMWKIGYAPGFPNMTLNSSFQWSGLRNVGNTADNQPFADEFRRYQDASRRILRLAAAA